MHSDGHTLRIIPKLIDLGLDAMNAQLFCMGVENLRPFRGKITFWGEIDRQHLLPYGTEEQIADADGKVCITLTVLIYGDVNGDGNINMGDVAKAYAHSKKTNYLRDEYQRQCADFNGDGRIDVGDVAKFYALAKVKS